MIIPKDLINGDEDMIEMDCFTWAKFYETCGADGTRKHDVPVRYKRATGVLAQNT